MKKLFFIVSVFLLSGCASVNPYALTKTQTVLDLSNNRGVALFTLKVNNPAQGSRLSLASFTARETNQYKAYNTLGYYSVPLTQESYSVQDDLYFCSAILTSGIYRLDSFNGMINLLFGVPYTLKMDKIFDVYPGVISYLGRLDSGPLDMKSAFMQLKSIRDNYEQDTVKFKEIFPVLQNKEIGKDSFY
ncbi:MAG: hypothetical protein WCY09_01230 [Candidatus Omnitrophota bacterium]